MEQWEIDAYIIDSECFSATQFREVKQVSRTVMISQFLAAGSKVFTVEFTKQVDPKETLTKLQNGLWAKRASLKTKAAFDEAAAALAKELLVGESRILTGYILKADEARGRAMVADLELPGGDRIRQVDFRTITSLIVEGVKYEVK
jgi:hypothetical protein